MDVIIHGLGIAENYTTKPSAKGTKAAYLKIDVQVCAFSHTLENEP